MSGMLHLVEKALNEIAFFVGCSIVVSLFCSETAGRNNRNSSLVLDFFDQISAVISFVGNHKVRFIYSSPMIFPELTLCNFPWILPTLE